VLASKPRPQANPPKSVDAIPASARQPKLHQGANYYGIHAQGNRFVFVVDSSTSMAGIRWESAVRELLTCLGRLPADSEFYVIFFSDRTEYMFRKGPNEVEFQPNTYESLARTRQWISSIDLGRSTQPLAALRTAVDMEPDAVFLLSDGEFRDSTLTWLRSTINRKTRANELVVPIHAIGLFSQAGLGCLREVASRSGGEFRQVMSSAW
jgi:hypothetical protein